MSKQRERVLALDFVRVVSMLSVILLHTSSAYIFSDTRVTFFGQPFAFAINQGVRYCVPLFFLVSGLSLELSYRGQSYAGFLKKRANKIILPYLFWTGLYYWHGLESFSLGELLKTVLLGKAAPHLYFIVALLQLYFLFLPLHRALEKKPMLTLSVSLILSFFLQWAMYLMVFQVNLLPLELRPYLVKTLFPWLFCFALGIYLAKTREIWRPIVLRYQTILISSTVVFALFYIIDSAATGSYDLSVKPILFLYVPLTFFALYALGEMASRVALLVRGIDGLAHHSMTIFFCHIFVLEYFREHYLLRGTSGMLLLSVLTILVSIVVALLFEFVVTNAKKLLRSSR